VNSFNASILHNVPEDIRCHHSSKSVEGDVENSSEGFLADLEFLNSFEDPGIPPHELVLKVGAICRLTRNFDASPSLRKNTRIIIRNLLRYTVEVKPISSLVAGKVVDPVCIYHHSCRHVEYYTRFDFTSHALTSSRIQFHCAPEANPPCAVLHYYVQRLPGPDCSETGA
jgi:hypothetical protein